MVDRPRAAPSAVSAIPCSRAMRIQRSGSSGRICLPSSSSRCSAMRACKSCSGWRWCSRCTPGRRVSGVVVPRSRRASHDGRGAVRPPGPAARANHPSRKIARHSPTCRRAPRAPPRREPATPLLVGEELARQVADRQPANEPPPYSARRRVRLPVAKSVPLYHLYRSSSSDVRSSTTVPPDTHLDNPKVMRSVYFELAAARLTPYG